MSQTILAPSKLPSWASPETAAPQTGGGKSTATPAPAGPSTAQDAHHTLPIGVSGLPAVSSPTAVTVPYRLFVSRRLELRRFGDPRPDPTTGRPAPDGFDVPTLLVATPLPPDASAIPGSPHRPGKPTTFYQVTPAIYAKLIRSIDALEASIRTGTRPPLAPQERTAVMDALDELQTYAVDRYGWPAVQAALEQALDAKGIMDWPAVPVMIGC